MSANNKMGAGEGGAETEFDPTTAANYGLVRFNPSLELFHQDRLDTFFGGRVVNVRNSLRDAGLIDGPDRLSMSMQSADGSFAVVFKPMQVGAGRNVVGGEWEILKAVDHRFKSIDEIIDDLTNTPVELAAEIHRRVFEQARLVEADRNGPASMVELPEIIPVGRPLQGALAAIFVPKAGLEASSGIKDGSGIVGFSREDAELGESPDIIVYFEGNLYGAENMRMWVDKVRQAYGRMVQKYPTVAMQGDFVENYDVVGVTDGNLVRLDDQPALMRWLTFANDLKSAPTETESRLPDRSRMRFR